MAVGFANRAIVAAGLGFAVSALVGCGGSGSLLSSGQANRLTSELAVASQALSDGRCARARDAVASFSGSVDSLGAVNQTLVANLEQGASTIANLTNSECSNVGPAETSPVKPATHPAKRPTRTTETVSTPTQTATTPATQTYTYSPPPTLTGTDTSSTTTPATTVPTDTTMTSTGTTPATSSPTTTSPSGGSSGGSGFGGPGGAGTTPSGGAGVP